MGVRSNHVFPLSFLLLLLSYGRSLYQVQARLQSASIGPRCKDSHSTYPCTTYVIYRASAPDFLDLSSITDLFRVGIRLISAAQTVSFPDIPLLPDQPLLLPIECSCKTTQGRSLSYAGVNYTLKSGDSVYSVATQTFQNLVRYKSIEFVSPSFDPVMPLIGDEIVVPVFCKCPNINQRRNQVDYLITYVFQPSDTLSTIASRFNVTEESIIDVNGESIWPFDAIFIPVSGLPNLALPIVPRAPEKKREDHFVVGLGIGLGACGLVLVLVWGLCTTYRRGLFKRISGIHRDDDGKKFLKPEEENMMAKVAGCLDKFKVYKIDELTEATNGFDYRSIIEGSVYRGCIDGGVYAIKKIKWNAREELKILQKVNHGNLVRLDGFCIDPKESNCYVVYEYVENGSLYSWLHEKKNRNKRLGWNTRLRIAIDVANGLQYIHDHTRPQVVHKDIKSSNILLDSNMRAKIASFGLAKSACNAVTMHIVCTRGYTAPEYLAEGVVSTKMDIFSFGVVLLELVSGLEVVDEEGTFLWAGVDGLLDGKGEGKLRKLREWMDERLIEESCAIESVMRVMAVAVACLHKDPRKRPSMVDIVYALSRNDDFVLYNVDEDAHYPR